ncbi:MAG: acyltransferase [Candidatus Levyibacteriota bacterium]
MKERNYTIDFLRLVAILAVVLIHTTNTSMQLGYYSLSLLPFSFFLNHFARFAVGVFFAISGYLLASRFNPKLPVLSFYKRRLSKLFLPYLVWSAIYYMSMNHFNPKSLFSADFFLDLLSGNASYQLYFIPTIICLYFLFPLFMKYKGFFLSENFLRVFFIFQVFLLFFLYTSGKDLPTHPTIRNVLINSLPFLCGMFIGVLPEKLKEYKRYALLVLVIAVSSLLLMMKETWEMFYLHANPNFVRTQWRVTSPIYSLSMALVLAYFHHDVISKLGKKISTQTNKVILLLSNHSMGVYFAHVSAISLFWRFWGSYLYSLTQGHIVYNPWFDVLQFFAVTGMSFVVIFIAGKIPVLGNLLGAKVG